MFEFAKFAGWLFSPLVIALVLWVAALWLLWCGRKRFGLAVGLLAGFGLWVVATPFVGDALVYPLERRFPAVVAKKAPQADVIVLLGGALGGAHPPQRPNFDLGSAADRVWHAADLFHAGKAPVILVTGGNQPGAIGTQVEAEAIHLMLLSLQVPAKAIRLETQSRNTLENAKNCLPIIQAIRAKRLLLVTSAMHMPRAMLTFEATFGGSGIVVLPASTDVLALPVDTHLLGHWLPDAASLVVTSMAVKEYFGLTFLSLQRFLQKIPAD